MKQLDWNDKYCLGHTMFMYKPSELTVPRYSEDSYIDLFYYSIDYETIILNQGVYYNSNDRAIETILSNKKVDGWKYYTVKHWPYFTYILGSK